jgi:hypothetical protein
MRLPLWLHKGDLPPHLADRCRWPRTWRQALQGFLLFSMLSNLPLFLLVLWKGDAMLDKAWFLPLALGSQAAWMALLLAAASLR